jgi:two-component system chemotaxis response regulator CheY
MFIRRCFEIAGWSQADFYEAADGMEALALLRQNAAIDLLVTDLNMPNMDGATLLKTVKEDGGLSKVAVMVITSAGNQAKEAELSALGAFCVLNKPISPAVLVEELGALLPK